MSETGFLKTSFFGGLDESECRDSVIIVDDTAKHFALFD
jgi:hypothetical protein